MINVSGRVQVLALAIAAFASPALGQDEPRLSLLTSFPNPTVSFQWELSERFALRAEGSYTFRDETTDRILGSSSFWIGGFTQTSTRERRTETTSHTTSIAVAPILTLRRTDRVGLYLAPRVGLTLTRDRIVRTDTETVTSSGTPGGVMVIFDGGEPSDPQTRTASDSHTSPTAGLSLGVVSNLHRRLALFGEAGLNYARSNNPLFAAASVLGAIDDSNSRRATLNSRAAAGMMIRF